MAWFENDPGAVNVRGGILGPMTGSQKAAMLFAGLRDAVGNFSGRPTENLNQLADQYGQMNYRQQVRQDRLDEKDAARKAEQDRREWELRNRAPNLQTGINPDTKQMGQYYMDPETRLPVWVKGVQLPAPKQNERKYRSGNMDITEVQDPVTGEWKRLASGNAFKPDSDSMRGVVVQPGAQVIDPRTGKVMYTAPKKPLPAALQKLESEDIDAIQTGRAISKDMGVIRKQIQNGDLTLSPVANAAAGVMNYAGVSNENSRRIATLKATLEKQRNDSLRLNKGVQTEGDAQRAWNEVMNNLNDPKLVDERLAEIQLINERAANLRAVQLNQRRTNSGIEPLDDSRFDPPAVLGGTGTTGAAPTQQTPPPSITPAQARAELERRRRARGGR